MQETVFVYDTTLRDGGQSEKISFSVLDKLKITEKLDSLGIHYIEGGWPGANPTDTEFFKAAKKLELKRAKLAAFGSTRKPGASCEGDKNLKALLAAETPVVCIFGKSWDFHVTEIMKNSLEENLKMIKESVAFLKKHGKEVVYDAEHFFDGFRANSEYALKTIKAAIDGGADWIALCDTNGGSLMWGIVAGINAVRLHFQSVKLGIHAHNDTNLAEANSLAAVNKGATMVQGTVNGYGERCGNADLTSVIPALQLKMGKICLSAENLARMKDLSRYVSEVANMTPFPGRPFVGKSAFAHKGGIHVSAIMKNPKAYEHVGPALVGNKTRIIGSDQGGKSTVEAKAREFGIELGANGVNSADVIDEIKRLEHEGFEFAGADASLSLLIKKLAGQFEPLFRLNSFRVTIEKNENQPCHSTATIKISVGDKEEITADEGVGPVDALNNAARKALSRFFADFDAMSLVDFKVRSANGAKGTAARVRVLIDSRDGKEVWTTVGVSEDIIEASWQALQDSFNHQLEQNYNARIQA